MKYSKSQRAELATNVFKNSMEPHFYVDGSGTFRTERQHQSFRESLKDDKQKEAYDKDAEKIVNPKLQKKKEEAPANTDAPKALEKMNLAELKAYAEENEVELADTDTTKALILEKIKAKESAQPEK